MAALTLSLFLLLITVVSGFLSPFVGRSVTFLMASTLDNVAQEVKVGDKLPNVVLIEGLPDFEKPAQIDLGKLIAGKKVAIFAVPGAFTPGCSKSHLPSFIDAQDELKAKGVEMTICVATNDAYVMEAWGRTSGGKDAGIRFLSDANGELTQALGMTIEKPVMTRSKRYSLIAEDGVVTHFFSADEDSSNTWAPNVLKALE
jgi:peroxiredoxin